MSGQWSVRYDVVYPTRLPPQFPVRRIIVLSVLAELLADGMGIRVKIDRTNILAPQVIRNGIGQAVQSMSALYRQPQLPPLPPIIDIFCPLEFLSKTLVYFLYESKKCIKTNYSRYSP